MIPASRVKTVNDVYMDVKEVMLLTGMAKSKCYELIRQFNEKLQAQGIYTIRGRVNRKFCYEQLGIADELPAPSRGRKSTR